MNYSNEADHPRGGDPNNPGQFAYKANKEAERSLVDDNDPLAGLNIDERIELAESPDAPTEILVQLGRDKNWSVQWRVARNPSTPAETLVQISEDEDPWVRLEVSRNPHTPKEILARLSEDNAPDVRREVVYNSNTPAEALIRLSKDEDPDVRRIARQVLQARANAS